MFVLPAKNFPGSVATFHRWHKVRYINSISNTVLFAMRFLTEYKPEFQLRKICKLRCIISASPLSRTDRQNYNCNYKLNALRECVHGFVILSGLTWNCSCIQIIPRCILKFNIHFISVGEISTQEISHVLANSST